MKTCNGCGISKSLDKFEKKRSRCKDCRNKWRRENFIARGPIGRKNRLLKGYGLTPTDYDAMFNKQNGVCAICEGISKNQWGTPVVVDHCHKTGIVRGLLCDKCNKGLGQFSDRPELLIKAAEYLRKER